MEHQPNSWTLGVDTSRKGVHLVLSAGDGLQTFTRENPLARGEAVSEELKALLLESGVSLDLVESVFVALGPGSFTGLRTGIAYSQGLCAQGKRKLVGISSLALLRIQFQPHIHGRVGVIMRARPGFWYVGMDAQGWPSPAFGGRLPEEEFLDDVAAARFLADASVILADQERPLEGPLNALHGNWHKVDSRWNLSLALPLMKMIPHSMNWNANYLQPSYAEQAPKKGA